MRPTRRPAVLWTGLLTVAVAMTAAAAAQEPVTPVPGAFCTLLTNDEASGAFGVPMELTAISGKSCTWSPVGKSAMDASLVPALLPGTLAENRDFYKDFPGGIEDITVGGQPGLLRVANQSGTDARTGSIFTESLGQVLEVDWSDHAKVTDVDIGAALKRVVEAALPRMSSITFAAPTQQPVPSFRTDADLAALFPKTIGGQPVTVDTMFVSDLLALSQPSYPESTQMIEQLTAVLASQGKTLDDVTLGTANAQVGDVAYAIVAVRVRGGDVEAVADTLIPLLLTNLSDPQITSGQVAGRDVAIVTDGASGQITYVLPSGEVAWLVNGQEPLLTEIIANLP